MRAVLTAAGVSLILSLVGTPLLIRFVRSRGYGQPIRAEIGRAHV